MGLTLFCCLQKRVAQSDKIFQGKFILPVNRGPPIRGYGKLGSDSIAVSLFVVKFSFLTGSDFLVKVRGAGTRKFNLTLDKLYDILAVNWNFS